MAEEDALAEMKPECNGLVTYQGTNHNGRRLTCMESDTKPCTVVAVKASKCNGKTSTSYYLSKGGPIPQWKILNEKRDLLCQNLTPVNHYPYLRSRYILSEDDQEVIESEKTRRQKVSKFLDILMKRGKKGFDELIKSIIEERTQLFLAKELNKAYEDKVKRVKALLSNQDLRRKNGLGPSFENIYSREHISGNSNQPQYRHSCPEVGGVMINTPNRDSISDLGVNTEKLPKPVKKKTLDEDATADLKSDVKLSLGNLTVRDHSLEEHDEIVSP